MSDYMDSFNEFWRDLVTDEHGNLDEDKVARELFDYGVVMEEASTVFEELAGFSKPNTAAHHVITAANQRFGEIYAEQLLDELEPYDPEGLTRDQLVAIAESWRNQ